MGKICIFTPRSDDSEKNLGTTSVEAESLPFIKYIQEVGNVRSKVSEIISKRGIINVSEMDLLVVLKDLIREEMIRKKVFSEVLFPCGDYISIAIYKFLMGNISLDRYTIDLLEQEDFKGAGDMNLLKYVFGYDAKRNNMLNARDYLNLASNMYYKAFSKGRMQLGHDLAYNLEKIDNAIGMHNMMPRILTNPAMIH